MASGAVEVALVWGPLAGYFAHRSAVALRLEPVAQPRDDAALPMTYDIAMGVRPDEPELRDRIDAILEKDRLQIEALLRAYQMPQAAPGSS